MNPPSTKLLFVLSEDFGELSIALQFVKGQSFDASLLLPDRLSRANANGLPVNWQRYRTEEDVHDAIAGIRPEIVLFCSGYLLAINRLLTPEAVDRLAEAARRTARAVVTTDPFVGILRYLDDRTFSDRHPQKAFLFKHFTREARRWQDDWHLYLCPPGPALGPKAVSFYNDCAIVNRRNGSASRKRIAEAYALDEGKPRWLFVLSKEDLAGQIGRLGERAFDDSMRAGFRAASRQGRQPIVIAPSACVERFESWRRDADDLLLLPFCGYDLFQDFLMEAEMAFYWNVFANSILPRLANSLPVFFFDDGHLARACPPLRQAGLEHYFGGVETVYLNPANGLALEELQSKAAVLEESLRPARLRLQSSPSPEILVARWLRG